MRGSSLVIDDKLYSFEEFDKLPHGLTKEGVSTLATPDGIAFQGHLSPLSNMFRCTLEDGKGRNATSAEHMYTIRMAEICNTTKETQKAIQAEENPYALKAIAKNIRKNAQWNKVKLDVLKEVMELKFVSHDTLMAKLQSYPKLHFYEATFDPIFGCGVSLFNADRISAANVDETSNRTGRLLEELRNKYRPTSET